jgi:hypothetical protein
MPPVTKSIIEGEVGGRGLLEQLRTRSVSCDATEQWLWVKCFHFRFSLVERMEKQDETDHEGGEDEEDSFFAGWSDVGRETLVEGQKANAGYLWKRGERNTGWKMRFFVFDGDVLRGARITYYVDDSQKTRKGAIDLSTLTGLEAPLEPSGAVEEAPGRGFDLRLPARGGRVWQLKAPTRHIRDTWARRIAALLNVPFEEMGPTTEETQRREASLDFREAMAKRQRIYVQVCVACSSFLLLILAQGNGGGVVSAGGGGQEGPVHGL